MKKSKYYFLWALLLVIFHFILLMIYFEPAISTPDAQGYFTQAKLIATKGMVSFESESFLEYIDPHWSPYMVKDSDTVWVVLEYFCNEGDELWNKSDDDFAEFAINELAQIDIIEKDDVLDSTVIRMPKTYPAYFGTYDNFHVIRDFTDKIENLFLIGRNGMHKYNNADHSMLTAMTAVETIIKGNTSKDNIWQVNAEEE